MKLIETKTLVSAAASIEFTSIPQDGTDLVLLLSLRATNTVEGPLSVALVAVNGNSNITRRELTGNGSTANSNTGTNLNAWAASSSATANTFSNSVFYIPNYTSNLAKSISTDQVLENNATNSFQGIQANLTNTTAAVTSISFTNGGGNLVAGSTISLYKITKGSDGIVTTS